MIGTRSRDTVKTVLMATITLVVHSVVTADGDRSTGSTVRLAAPPRRSTHLQNKGNAKKPAGHAIPAVRYGTGTCHQLLHVTPLALP